MANSRPPGLYQESDDAEPRYWDGNNWRAEGALAPKDPPQVLSSVLSGRRFRFLVVALVAVLWLLAECTHSNRHVRALESFVEPNVTAISAIGSASGHPEPYGAQSQACSSHLCSFR